MTRVTRIDWIIQTGFADWSGTDSRIDVEIYRDGNLLASRYLERGNTSRLGSGELAMYYWTVEPPGSPPSLNPAYEDFPQGVRGHLHVKLIARGDDAWEKSWLQSKVHSIEFRPSPSVHWESKLEIFDFDRDVVLSTDPDEGYRTLTLHY